MSKKILGALSISLAVVIGLLIGQIEKAPQVVSGSVNQSNEYQATTTSTGRFPTLVTLTSTSTFPTQGALGSVIITGAAAGVINLYDATTSNVNLRDSSQATSSIYLTTIPASAAAGTYTFDEVYRRGVLVEIIGTMPTTTITFR